MHMCVRVQAAAIIHSFLAQLFSLKPLTNTHTTHTRAQEFIERYEVRHSRAARLVCIHLAAIHMDHGVAEGGHARAHALQALQHIQGIMAEGSSGS